MRWVAAALLTGATALAMSTSANAREPVVLQPSSKWNVDFAPNKCRLARIFGEGDNQHFLFFEQYYPSALAGLTVAGPELSRYRSRQRTSLTFYEGQEEFRSEPFTGELEGIGNAVIYSNVHIGHGVAPEGDDDDDALDVPQLDPELGDRVEYVMVEQRGRPVRFETGPLGDAFAVLNTCTQDMIREWGLDVDQHLSARRRPEWTNQQAVVRRIVDQYPASALRSGEQAILRMRVIVSEDGKVEKCSIDASTTNELDSPACREMERAEFEPALDAQGEPFRSYYATTITYMMS